MQDIIKYVEKSQLRTDLPELEIGDLIKVYLKIVEGTRERLQVFEGYLIARKGGGIRETIASLRNDINAIYKTIRELEQTIRELEAGKRADRMSANARKIELKRQLDEEGGA